jgi:xanthine permease XanP
LENCGMDWGARPDVIARAGMAVGEALEALHGANLLKSELTHRATFDEYNLVVRLDYPGKAISFAAETAIDLQALMDDENDDALDAAMSNMSGLLIRNLADSVSSGEEGERAKLQLQFTH